MRPGSVHDLKSYLDLGWAVADVVVIVITDRVTDAALAERFNCRQCDLGRCAGGKFKHFKYRNIVAASGGVLLEAHCTYHIRESDDARQENRVMPLPRLL